MNFQSLPEPRAKRRVIYVLSQSVIDALDTDPGYRDLVVREDVAILHAATDVTNADRITRSLDAQGLLVPGLVLVLSPFGDTDYAPVDEAIDRFSLQKWTSMSTLCAYLGASSVSVNILEDTRAKASIKFKTSGTRLGFGGTAKGSSKALDKFKGQMNLNDTYSGGASDIEGANKFLATSGLMADPVIRSMVDARSFEGNRLSKRRLTIDLSRETQRSVDAAIEIKVPAVLNVGATVEHAKETLAQYTVTLTIKFADQSS